MTISFSKVGSSKSKAVSLVRIAYTNDTDIDVATEWVDQAAQILNEQWPLGGPINAYKEKIVQDFNNDPNKFYGLPCSYLLIENEKTCIGCVESVVVLLLKARQRLTYYIQFVILPVMAVSPSALKAPVVTQQRQLSS